MLRPSTLATWNPNVTISVAYTAADTSVCRPDMTSRHMRTQAPVRLGAASSTSRSAAGKAADTSSGTSIAGSAFTAGCQGSMVHGGATRAAPVAASVTGVIGTG